MSSDPAFWPEGARVAVTVSMQFEAGGQPISGSPGPVTEAVEPGYSDLPQNSFYEYGVREGIPRMLDLFDKHSIKVTSYMIGAAVEKHPALAGGDRPPRPRGCSTWSRLGEPVFPGARRRAGVDP
jgi:peptidoglycan/xylan/chitin deacetylase (PgdA/CDA1 family)